MLKLIFYCNTRCGEHSFYSSAEISVIFKGLLVDDSGCENQLFAILIANSSLYSNSKFRFIFTPLRTKSRQSREWNPQPVAVWNLAKGEYGIKTEVEEIQPTD